MSADQPSSSSPATGDAAPDRERVRISRVFTRGGDTGMTSLVGGQRVSKADPRLEAYGTGDELQVVIGIARDALEAARTGLPEPSPLLDLISRHLRYLQNMLFTVNGDLATRLEDRWSGMPLVGEDELVYLEELIQSCTAALPPLRDFVLPGGHPAVTGLHLCRVVCRRMEREVEALAGHEPIGDMVRPFLNRMSDVFFVLGRRVGAELVRLGQATPETIWQREMELPPLP